MRHTPPVKCVVGAWFHEWLRAHVARIGQSKVDSHFIRFMCEVSMEAE